jgi:hypothetical protein
LSTFGLSFIEKDMIEKERERRRWGGYICRKPKERKRDRWGER